MRAGAVILTLLLALLSFQATGSEAVPSPDLQGEIALGVFSRSPVCPHHATVCDKCCFAICGNLIPAPANSLTLKFVLLVRLSSSPNSIRGQLRAERLYRPPKLP